LSIYPPTKTQEGKGIKGETRNIEKVGFSSEKSKSSSI